MSDQYQHVMCARLHYVGCELCSRLVQVNPGTSFALCAGCVASYRDASTDMMQHDWREERLARISRKRNKEQ